MTRKKMAGERSFPFPLAHACLWQETSPEFDAMAQEIIAGELEEGED
jgi:hypothetical protein